MDKVKLVYENFLKVSKNYTLHAYDYEPELNEKVFDFANTVTSNASTFAERISGQQLLPKAQSQEIPPSLSHAFAKAAYESANDVDPKEPLEAALKKFALAQERMGNARLRQDDDVKVKFYNPLVSSLTNKIGEALKARKNVQSVRLVYDACRGRLRSAQPQRAEGIRSELEKCEDEFVAAVDDAMGKMKRVVENNDLLRHLADLVAVQLQYHKAVFECLSELSPEIDELVVTNDAMYAPRNQ